MSKSAIIIAALSTAFVLGTTVEADALSRHERLEVKEIKKGGEVVGVRLKLTLRAESGHDKVRVGIGPNTMKTADFASGSDSRKKASDKGQGYLLHQWDEIKVEPNKPKEVTLEVLYKDAPGLKPGAEVEIISAWHGENASYWHVYGAQAFGNDKGNLKKLPGKAAAARRDKISDIKRSGRRNIVRKTAQRSAKRTVSSKKVAQNLKTSRQKVGAKQSTQRRSTRRSAPNKQRRTNTKNKTRARAR